MPRGVRVADGNLSEVLIKHYRRAHPEALGIPVPPDRADTRVELTRPTIGQIRAVLPVSPQATYLGRLRSYFPT